MEALAQAEAMKKCWNTLALNRNKDIQSLVMDFPTAQPADTDTGQHNDFYDAIRSGSVELLEKEIREVPAYLDEQLSRAYEELRLLDVPLSEEMKFFVEDKLIQLRFFSKKNTVTKPQFKDVTDRIDMVRRDVKILISEYSCIDNQVDDKFLFLCRFTAQNIYVLKRLLRSTYDKLPWEEMEFCLVAFVTSYVKKQEINLIYNALLVKQRLLDHLGHFEEVLAKMNVRQMDVNSNLPKFDRTSVKQSKRTQIMAKIVSDNPKFGELYCDYEQVKDVYSLSRIKYFIELALFDGADIEWHHLVVERALQVTGEYIKNTVESPHLTEGLSNLLMGNFRKGTKNTITELRDRLSHVLMTQGSRDRSYLLGQRIEATTQGLDFQDDLRKLSKAIDSVIYASKNKVLVSVLEKIANSHSLEQVQLFLGIFRNVNMLKQDLEHVTTSEFEEVVQLVLKLKKEVVRRTVYEDQLFQQIDNILFSESAKLLDVKLRYNVGFSGLQTLINYMYSKRSLQNIQHSARSILKPMKLGGFSQQMSEIAQLATKLYDSFRTTLSYEQDLKTRLIVCNICYIVDLKTDRIDHITNLRETLEIKANEANVENRIKWIFSELKNTNELHDEDFKKAVNNFRQIQAQRKAQIGLSNILKGLSTASESELMSLVEQVGLTKRLRRSFYKQWKEKNWEGCIKLYQENVSQSTMQDFDKSVATFLKTGEFDQVRKLFPSEMFEEEVYDKVKNALRTVQLKQNNLFKHHFEDRLERLRDLLNTPLAASWLEHTPTNETKRNALFAAMEILLLDIMGYLEEKENLVDKGSNTAAAYLDRCSAIFTGKQLRNTLAHGNALVDVLPTDQSFAVVSNALKIASTNFIEINHDGVLFIGQPTLELRRLKTRYDNCLRLINIQRDLFAAAEQDNIEKMEECLRNKAEINARDINRWNILHYAAKGDSLNVMTRFLNQQLLNGGNIEGQKPLHIAGTFGSVKVLRLFIENLQIDASNCVDYAGQTPLVCAINCGQVEAVRIMLDAGFILEILNTKGVTALHLAAELGHEAVVRTLLDRGASTDVKATDNMTALHLAANNGHNDIVRALLNTNAQVDAITAKDNLTPLHLAAQNGCLDVVQTLLDNKSNVDARAKGNVTPLHLAALNGHHEVVHALLYWNATVDSRSTDGVTPLHSAIHNGHNSVVKVLLENHANVDAKIKHYATPLHYAALNGHTAIVQALLDSNASVDSKTDDGETPLHAAALQGDMVIVQALLNRNATVDIRNRNDETPLHFAAKSGHQDIALVLLNLKADFNAKTAHSMTPLHFAAQNGHKEIVKILLNRNTKIVSKTTSNEETALHLAAFNGHTDIVRILLSKNATVNSKTRDGATPLRCAAQNGHKDVVQILLENNATPNSMCKTGWTPLYIAAEKGHHEIVQTLVNKNAAVNTKHKDNVTALHVAAQKGHLDVVRVLLRNYAIVDAKTKNEDTPLHLAVLKGHTDIVLALLEYNTTVDAANIDSLTPLYVAAQNNLRDIVQALLNKNASTEAKDETPLHTAAFNGHMDVVRILLDNQANINARAIDGHTPLHCAALMGHIDIVQLLLDQNATVDSKTKDGLTPLYVAAEKGHRDVVGILLERSAKLDAEHNYGGTPLHIAAANGHTAVVDVLLDKIMILDLKNKDEVTPLHIAAHYGHNDVVQVLLDRDADVNSRDNVGNTPLHAAAMNGHKCVVRMLLIKNALVSARNASNQTPAFYAARGGHKDIVKMLMDEITKIN